jgi:Na+/H+ antiporter NhaD/arsenite permease-like protein
MRLCLADMFSLLAAVAGWFYLFYSKAATQLAGIESQRQNIWRHRFRRLNGLLMFLLAIGFFAGFNSVDEEHDPKSFFLIWSGVMLVLLLVTALVFVDIRLTWKLRHSVSAKERR